MDTCIKYILCVNAVEIREWDTYDIDYFMAKIIII